MYRMTLFSVYIQYLSLPSRLRNHSQWPPLFPAVWYVFDVQFKISSLYPLSDYLPILHETFGTLSFIWVTLVFSTKAITKFAILIESSWGTSAKGKLTSWRLFLPDWRLLCSFHSLTVILFFPPLPSFRNQLQYSFSQGRMAMMISLHFLRRKGNNRRDPTNLLPTQTKIYHQHLVKKEMKMVCVMVMITHLYTWCGSSNIKSNILLSISPLSWLDGHTFCCPVSQTLTLFPNCVSRQHHNSFSSSSPLLRYFVELSPVISQGWKEGTEWENH